MRRRRLLLVATVLVVVVAVAVGFVVTRTSSKTSRTAPPGPLVAETNGYYSNTYSHVGPGEKVTIAALVVTNSGSSNVTLERATAVGASNVEILGTFALDRDRVSPGSYRSFPPKLGDKPISLRRSSALGPVPPGGTLLLATGLQLADGRSAGAIGGIRLDYRMNGRAYQSSYPDATGLCPGDANADRSCQASLAAAQGALVTGRGGSQLGRKSTRTAFTLSGASHCIQWPGPSMRS